MAPITKVKARQRTLKTGNKKQRWKKGFASSCNPTINKHRFVLETFKCIKQIVVVYTLITIRLSFIYYKLVLLKNPYISLFYDCF